MFTNRSDAGRSLAERLVHLRGEDVVVVGLPRGGVPVALEVARALGAPLDVILVRKLGVPFQPELAMGAIGEGGARVVDEDIVRRARVSAAELSDVEARESAELDRRAERFRGGRDPVRYAGRTVVVVDDGIATGSTARAACLVARARDAARVVLAVPVAPRGWEARIGDVADELVAVSTPDHFYAIGQWYTDFSQTTDDEVIACLSQPVVRSSAAEGPQWRDETGPPRRQHVAIAAGPVTLAGNLCVPHTALGIVVFAHGSGSSRHSPRNRYVAEVLNQAGLGTLLFDLLTRHEEHDRANVFDIELLARRLTDATAWLRALPEAGGVPIGYFGASTGAAAALWAAAEAEAHVGAVVSRGGRPDLAAPRLSEVRAPTLLIVGGNDRAVLSLNREAQELLRCESHLAVIPGATHLFEEPGTLGAAAAAARDWFVGHLAAAPTAA